MRAWRRMVLIAALASCRPGGEAPGAAAQAFCGGYGILGVQVEPLTFHTTDPARLLESAEGAGPRTLNLTVSNAVSPQISVTSTYTPSNSQFSKALGYDVTQTVTLSADSSVLVPVYAYARVDAYPDFQKTLVTIGADCNGPTVLGSAEVLKPVGVYFDTCGCISPDPCGVGCVSGFPFGGGGGGGGGQPVAIGGAGAGGGSPGDPDGGDGG
jgi:hypothetical protein